MNLARKPSLNMTRFLKLLLMLFTVIASQLSYAGVWGEKWGTMKWNCSQQAVLNTLTLEQQIQLVYVGLLERGADSGGLAYWINDINSGFTIEKLRDNVVNSQPEYLQDLGLLTRANLVPRLYQNLFSRTPPADDTGLAYWVSGGGTTVTIDKLVLALINGAGCTDANTLLNKAEVATYYTNNYTTYDKAEAVTAVANVDSTNASVVAAKAYADSLSIDPEYNKGATISVTGDGSDFFKREVTVNGVRIMAAGAVGEQLAVPDAWLEKVARVFELFTDPSGAGINESFQREVIKNLSGDAGTWHAGLPTIQRVARGAGADYTPNFLTDSGISYWNLTNLFDTHVQNDMVWYLNSTGDGYGDGDNDAQEVIEHVFHTLHMHGLDAQTLKMYSYLASDWASGPLYAAMEEAYDGGFWDPSGYEASPGAFKTDSGAFEVAAKEYLFLLNFSMFEYTSLWEGGSLAPEWSDTVRTQAGILANNPLGYALHNTYIAPVISKPSLATIRSLFPDGDTP